MCNRIRALTSLVTTILTVTAFVGSTASARGGMDSGGGDPFANEFLVIAEMISKVLPIDQSAELGPSSSDLLQEIDTIRTSLDGHKPLLVFPAGETVDCFGAAKLGCVKGGTIFIARDSWQNRSSFNTKVELSAMELLLRLGVSDRYEKASRIAKVVVLHNTPSVSVKPSLVKACPKLDGHRCLNSFGFIYVNPAKLGGLLQDVMLDNPMVLDIAPMNRICLRRRKDANSGKTNTLIPHRADVDLQDFTDQSIAIFEAYEIPTDLPLNGFPIVRRFSLSIDNMLLQASQLARRGFALRVFFDWNTKVASAEIRSGSDVECALSATGE